MRLQRFADLVRPERRRTGVAADVRSIIVDDGHDVVFVHLRAGDDAAADSHALGEAIRAHARQAVDKTIDEVYWKFPAARSSAISTSP